MQDSVLNGPRTISGLRITMFTQAICIYGATSKITE